MSRYVDISPYEKCRIVSNPEDNGFPVSELPTVDAEPVRHGHWYIDESDGSYSCKCGLIMWTGDLIYGNANYCLNCGARMDETEWLR